MGFFENGVRHAEEHFERVVDCELNGAKIVSCDVSPLLNVMLSYHAFYMNARHFLDMDIYRFIRFLGVKSETKDKQ